MTSNYGAVQTHTYAANTGSSFNVCATAYSPCGQNQTCQTVGFTTSVGDLDALGNISIHPNPTTGALIIEGAEARTSYSVHSIVGQVLQCGTVSSGRHIVTLGALPAGMYMLVLAKGEGACGTIRIIKQ